jgi:membrane associated rhomboid family serine protease
LERQSYLGRQPEACHSSLNVRTIGAPWRCGMATTRDPNKANPSDGLYMVVILIVTAFGVLCALAFFGASAPTEEVWGRIQPAIETFKQAFGVLVGALVGLLSGRALSRR